MNFYRPVFFSLIACTLALAACGTDESSPLVSPSGAEKGPRVNGLLSNPFASYGTEHNDALDYCMTNFNEAALPESVDDMPSAAFNAEIRSLAYNYIRSGNPMYTMFNVINALDRVEDIYHLDYDSLHHCADSVCMNVPGLSWPNRRLTRAVLELGKKSLDSGWHVDTLLARAVRLEGEILADSTTAFDTLCLGAIAVLKGSAGYWDDNGPTALTYSAAQDAAHFVYNKGLGKPEATKVAGAVSAAYTQLFLGGLILGR